MKNENEIRETVQKAYSRIANSSVELQNGCCTTSESEPCCITHDNIDLQSLRIGYTEDDIRAVPENSNLGLGSGNPIAIANLQEGETVVDLGSGAGFDVFLASGKVGKKGKAIGVDMTQAMIAKARKNATKIESNNVEFRLGEIEHLPVGNDFADVIISNCVINLSPEKQQVFNEAFRVLKSGGRLAISDPVSLGEIAEEDKRNMDLYCSCISGASSIDSLTNMLENSGFVNIKITPQNNNLNERIVSAYIEATKPLS
ncbi:arsenite methyltransferase [Maribellus sediminis]|uniref:arsenite methyltransferase n=1 Tax=Maribellus sediminis TaxID=2696285 RepID=UPI00198193B1|nr:arsenite methyltransferase [Maribellus sediminis]